MFRHSIQPRTGWQQLAERLGFNFHTLYGQPYWDESGYYQFSLQQIENHLEDPCAELQQMCLQVVERVVNDERLLSKLQIPQAYWQAVADSWHSRQPSLYSRMDFAYDGKHPAKLLENNADTPTSLYETGFWQWLWLEQLVDAGELPQRADQFNSLQEHLILRFAELEAELPGFLHLACSKDTDEDLGTVRYLEDCAHQAGLRSALMHVEDIGIDSLGRFVDVSGQPIKRLFKLYPWEFMLREEYGPYVIDSQCQFLEPLWKSVLSNKGLLPLLWQMFPNHPNLLPAYFEDDPKACLSSHVRKPIFSREGANISIVEGGKVTEQADGPYGAEGYIVQAYQPLPKFAQSYTLIGAWLVGDSPAGISVREDSSRITQDLSRFLPHIILD